MRREGFFWRNVGAVALLHAALVLGVVRWSGAAKKPAKTDIVWMDGGALNVDAASAFVAMNAPAPSADLPPEQEPTMAEQPPAEPAPSAAASEIVLASPTPADTPKPLPTPAATAAVTPRPTASPKSSPTPKASPKPTPKPSPSVSSKKSIVAKTAPTASAKSTASAVAKKAPNTESTRAAVAEAKPPAAMREAPQSDAKGSTAAPGAAGSDGQGGGAGSASDAGWYGKMLHDRFHGVWVQPKATVMAGAKMSALVRVRIENDGRVSAFNIVRSSGNVIVDESVAAIAQRVPRVDPLPKGVGAGFYEVNITFDVVP